MKYPAPLEKLQRLLTKLPGVGRKTAERYAFDFLLEWEPHELNELQQLFQTIKSSITTCPTCGALQDQINCYFCNDAARRHDVICIVATARDVFTIESTREYRGLYHVLGNLLSPLDGRGIDVLQLPRLFERLSNVKEVIVALDSTLEGDATALFIKQELEQYPVKVSRLAFGIPVGSSLDYVDGGTLARAFVGRASF